MPKDKTHTSTKMRAVPYEKVPRKESTSNGASSYQARTEVKSIEQNYQHVQESNMDDDLVISTEWKLNVLLDKISQSLKEEDLPRMKFYCRAGTIGRKALSEAVNPLMFFQLLMDNEFLNCNNLLHLQAMIWHIGRKDLYKDMVAFARECRRQPLYFFTPKIKPVNGYKHVKFHIGGSETNRREVENLRGVVAELLCVQHEDVMLVGFEPSNSIIITFMVPEEAIETLYDLEPEDRSVLKSMKVDYIFQDEQEIPLIGEKMQKPTTISQIEATSKLLRDRDQLTSKLGKLQSLLQKRNEELRQAKVNEKLLQQSRDQAFIAFMTLLNNHRPTTTAIDSLVNKSGMVYFRHSLQTFRSKFPDEMDAIETLLEAKELLACKAERDAWRQHTESIRLLNQLETNSLRIQHTMAITKLQGISYNQKPPVLYPNGHVTTQNRTIQVDVAMVTEQVQTGDLPKDMQIEPAKKVFNSKVIRAFEDISNMLNLAQKKSLLRQSGISESDEHKYLKNNGQFMQHLYRAKPAEQVIDELEFALKTCRQLDDKKLDEGVYKVVMSVVKYRDEQCAMLQ
ncbi:uncharacterized protein LOC117332691 [Pecten maximus]|uniref:uncharacterized protein LOC117332691 n=1 Tax=Pecten maximus TaxID=6579 RepID=UPI001458C740|nr:uncharacterized protein LOC117332691 [Pecten maximus]